VWGVDEEEYRDEYCYYEEDSCFFHG
jgi:hypothetical protein